MIKCFYVTGDSFAFGEELGINNPNVKIDNQAEFTEYHRQHCYSGIIASKLKIPNYINSAAPGGSNERAYRYLITDIPKLLKKYQPEEIFVNVSLTHAARREFYTPSNHAWSLYMASHEPSKSHRIYHSLWSSLTKDFNGDFGYCTFDIMIHLAIQNFLMVNKIPYLLTSSMGNALETALRQQYIDKEVLDQIYLARSYTDLSFSMFSHAMGCKVGPNHHPLEDGHREWSTHLFDHILRKNLLDNSDL